MFNNIASIRYLVLAVVLAGCTVVDEANVDEPIKMLTPNVDVVITPQDVEDQDLKDIIYSYGENTRFLITAGTYRMQTIKPKKGMVFYGDVDTAGNRYTILNGSRLLTNFSYENGLYYVSGQSQEGDIHGVPEKSWEGSVHSEDLFFDDVAMKQVLSKAEVTDETWYFDYDNDTIWFSRNPEGHKVETSVTPYAFDENVLLNIATEVTIKGFIVEKYANIAQSGAIGANANNKDWLVVYNEVRLNHGAGIQVKNNSRVMYNYVHHNGHIGLRASGDTVLFQGNETSYNNTQHFELNWESGGGKFTLINNLILKGNYSHHNNGRGLWIDVGSHNIIIDNNLVTHNKRDGIHLEISDNAVISNNRVAHNGLVGPTLGGANILLSTSSDVTVHNNRVVVNKERGNGIIAVWHDRHLSYAKVGHTPPLRVENLNIHDNDITYLGTLNLSSVTETDPNGAPPRAGAGTSEGVNEYDAMGTIDGVAPVGNIVFEDVSITEERLNNIFENNSYHIPDTDVFANWFQWGQKATWNDFQAGGNEANGSIDGNVFDDSVSWVPHTAYDVSDLIIEEVW